MLQQQLCKIRFYSALISGAERRRNDINSSLSSLPSSYFFLSGGYSKCQLCFTAAVQCTLLQRSHPRCTPSNPLNCQLWSSILSLVLSLLASGHSSWLQEDKRSCTESVLRSAAASCLAAASLFRALPLLLVWEASFTAIALLSPSLYFLFHFFLLKFSTLQTHPPLSCTAGLICLSGLALRLSFSFFSSQIVHLSLPLLTFYSTISILLSLTHLFSSCLPCWVFR